MIAIKIHQVKEVQDKFSSEIKKFIANRTMRLQNILPANPNHQAYLNLLLVNLKDIILAQTSKLEEYSVQFEALIPHESMGADENQNFRNDIQNALNYKDLRTNFYSAYFRTLGIKACVYCNAQLAVSIEREDNHISAKFQVDHFYPKSEYPCFSISLFYLYPVCGPCNNVKLERSVSFRLYSADEGLLKSPYRFMLNEGSKLSFLANGDIDDIRYDFIEDEGDIEGEKLQNVFDIQGIYDTQKDIAQELILKSRSSPKSYKEGLKNSFGGIFHNQEMLNRLLVGNYTSEIDLHKRPMAKFMMDLARQLKMLD